MTTITFLRHFQTAVDPETPVAQWQLSDEGRTAMEAFLDDHDFSRFDRVATSPEPKAGRTAGRIAQQAGIPLREDQRLAEVDRSAEGFIDDHDRYLAQAEQYLRDQAFDVDWEPRDQVRERMGAFLNDQGQENILAVTHGLILTLTVAPRLGREPFPFWQDLGFGDTVGLDA
ncbi:MAG: histidine phosphatase family protein [Candidatus Nanohaloarchaea archaeon]|nr:histidine phosphatase family protein [Candidatus Nanohaloarchaea archaeon]